LVGGVGGGGGLAVCCSSTHSPLWDNVEVC